MHLNKFTFVVIIFLLSGCSHNLVLYPRNGGSAGNGVAQEIGKTITISIDRRTYQGTYIHDGVKVSSYQNYGSATAFSAGRSATAYGSGFGTAYIPGTGNGRIFATSGDGASINCEFNYSNGSGLGVCTDTSGKVYDLVIAN